MSDGFLGMYTVPKGARALRTEAISATAAKRSNGASAVLRQPRANAATEHFPNATGDQSLSIVDTSKTIMKKYGLSTEKQTRDRTCPLKL